VRLRRPDSSTNTGRSDASPSAVPPWSGSSWTVTSGGSSSSPPFPSVPDGPATPDSPSAAAPLPSRRPPTPGEPPPRLGPPSAPPPLLTRRPRETTGHPPPLPPSLPAPAPAPAPAPDAAPDPDPYDPEPPSGFAPHGSRPTAALPRADSADATGTGETGTGSTDPADPTGPADLADPTDTGTTGTGAGTAESGTRVEGSGARRPLSRTSSGNPSHPVRPGRARSPDSPDISRRSPVDDTVSGNCWVPPPTTTPPCVGDAGSGHSGWASSRHFFTCALPPTGALREHPGPSRETVLGVCSTTEHTSYNQAPTRFTRPGCLSVLGAPNLAQRMCAACAMCHLCADAMPMSMAGIHPSAGISHHDFSTASSRAD